MADSLIKRSPIHHLLEAHQPEWNQNTDVPIAIQIQSNDAERKMMQTLGLCDLSGLHKLGVKGSKAENWLAGQGMEIPASIYESRKLSDGGYIVRLATDEFLLESGPRNEVVPALETELKSNGGDCLRVERQDATFLLVGSRSIEVLLQTCGINFEEAASRHLIFTRVAGVSCGILPDFMEEIPTYRFWFDNSYAVYLWETLAEICHDLGGNIVGAGSVFPEFK